VTVAGQAGWGGAQTLMLLAVLAVFALILLPSVVSRVLRARKDASS
jgi:phosphate transport system substrate-binding protein